MSKSGLVLVWEKRFIELVDVYIWFVFGHGEKKWLVELFHVYIRFVFWYGKKKSA